MARPTRVAFAALTFGSVIAIAVFIAYFPVSLFVVLLYAGKLAAIVPGPPSVTYLLIGVGVLMIGIAPIGVLTYSTSTRLRGSEDGRPH